MIKLLLLVLLTTVSSNIAVSESNNMNATVIQARSQMEKSITLTGEDASIYAESMNLENINSVESITVYYSVDQNDDYSAENYYFGDDYYIKSDTITTEEKIGDRIRKSTYYGPCTASMTITESISASFSFDFEVSSSELKAKLGYSMTSTFSISDSYSIDVSNGSNMTIECYIINEISTFEVWEDDIWFDDYVGEYSSAKPIGCAFVRYEA